MFSNSHFIEYSVLREHARAATSHAENPRDMFDSNVDDFVFRFSPFIFILSSCINVVGSFAYHSYHQRTGASHTPAAIFPQRNFSLYSMGLFPSMFKTSTCVVLNENAENQKSCFISLWAMRGRIEKNRRITSRIINYAKFSFVIHEINFGNKFDYA
jgi:hypothetical protein